jgi:hypothetical protein
VAEEFLQTVQRRRLQADRVETPVRVADTLTKVAGIGEVAKEMADFGRVFQCRSTVFVHHGAGSG